MTSGADASERLDAERPTEATEPSTGDTFDDALSNAQAAQQNDANPAQSSTEGATAAGQGPAPESEKPVAEPSGLLFSSPPVPNAAVNPTTGPLAAGDQAPNAASLPAQGADISAGTSAAKPTVDPLAALMTADGPGAKNDGGATGHDGGDAETGSKGRQANQATAMSTADGKPAELPAVTVAKPTIASAGATGAGNASTATQPAPNEPSTERSAGAASAPHAAMDGTPLTPAARDALAPLLELARTAEPAAAGEKLHLPTPTSSTTEEAPTTPLVSRGLAALANQRGGALAIRLDPPSLGDLRITMTVVNGRVTAELLTSNPQAHALLRSDLASLRQALEAQGLAVDRLSIQSAPTHPSAAGRGDAPASHASHAQPASQASQQQGSQDSDSGHSQDRGQQRHDAGQGQSRGRSSHFSGQSGESGERNGSRSRRHATFARVFASSTLP
ncbi:MAG: flagellar hook-length control protein FliK [Phycisphaerae bacterium]|nr:flagellar hook-length control protein FliK [Phycisphaerae bacterium]